ncbi:CS domain-containing protein [Longirhabdus pacifica]|uniref:CS domain-containing protein n=1 Tax=Longirhabdus pacifica TaxID=2305227 RepID=UPI0013E8AA91|nr:CS domain-containing protein [Longirhabdus pacifica]
MNNQSPFDWGGFEKFFGGNIPAFTKEMQNQMQQDPAWMEKHIKDMMENLLPNFAGTNGANNTSTVKSTGSPVQHEEFETHRDLFLKVYLPSKTSSSSNVRLFSSVNSIRIKGIDDHDPFTVSLSQNVDPSSCKATVKNNVLQIQMKKAAEAEMYQEVKVSFL